MIDSPLTLENNVYIKFVKKKVYNSLHTIVVVYLPNMKVIIYIGEFFEGELMVINGDTIYIAGEDICDVGDVVFPLIGGVVLAPGVEELSVVSHLKGRDG